MWVYPKQWQLELSCKGFTVCSKYSAIVSCTYIWKSSLRNFWTCLNFLVGDNVLSGYLTGDTVHSLNESCVYIGIALWQCLRWVGRPNQQRTKKQLCQISNFENKNKKQKNKTKTYKQKNQFIRHNNKLYSY